MRYLLCILLLIIPTAIQAQEMTSPSYTLELEQIEATTSAKTGTLNPLQEKQFFKKGYIIQETQHQSLQFTISDTSINLTDFKQEAVQTHSVLTNINGANAYGYQIVVKPLQALETTSTDQIPATQCDSKQICTPFSAGIWSNIKSVGWGYTISGPDGPLDFKNGTYFRPFKTGQATIIATHNATTGQRATKITIKTVTDNNVPDGNYGSIIKIVAVPKL